VHLDNAAREALQVCSILLGFLFAGFWWTLNRELTFKAEDRHFKLGIGLFLVGDGDARRVWRCSAHAGNC
jgi:hypothetical protein